MSGRAPPLLVDDVSDYSSVSESESDGSTSANEWFPISFPLLSQQPTAKDYDQDGLIKRNSSFFILDEEGNKEILSVSENDPMLRGLTIPLNESKKASKNGKKNKSLKIDVPKYSDNRPVQLKSTRNFFTKLLANYSDYNLLDVALKCREFVPKTSDEFEIAFKVFYDKAVSSEVHAFPLALLCKKLVCSDRIQLRLFKETVSSSCQKEFLRLKQGILGIAQLSTERALAVQGVSFPLLKEHFVNQFGPAEVSQVIEYEYALTCHMSFFAELYNAELLSCKMVVACVNKVVDEDHVDFCMIRGLYQLLRRCGAKIETDLRSESPNKTAKFASLFERLLKECSDPDLHSDLKQVIWDIAVLRTNHWRELRTPSELEEMERMKAELSALDESEKSAVKSAATSKKEGDEPAPAGTSSASSNTTANSSLNKDAIPFFYPPSSASKEPLLVTPSKTGEQPNESKVEKSLAEKLSNGWKNILDGKEDDAIRTYKECLVLFNVLNYQHPQMISTLVCVYMLISDHDPKDVTLDSIYDKLRTCYERDQPSVDFVMLKHLSRDETNLKLMLVHYQRLVHALEGEWAPVEFPLSKRKLESSEKGAVEEWLNKLVLSLKFTHREMFNECRFENCSTPNTLIVEFDDFESQDEYKVLECSEKCRQYFHHKCFKSLPKWNIDEPCVTPDCEGVITKLYEKTSLKRESKKPLAPAKKKHSTPSPAPNQSAKKQRNKRSDSGSKNSISEVAEEISPASSPTPPDISTSPEPKFTGDDIIDMFGTMLIVLEEYRTLHLTTMVMEMNSIYSWVRVELFNEFIDIGVQSLEVSADGTLSVKPGTDEEKESRKDSDITRLIDYYKNSPISSLKQELDSRNNQSTKSESSQQSQSKVNHNGKKGLKNKRSKKASGSGKNEGQQQQPAKDQKTEHPTSSASKQRTLSGSLNPSASSFTPSPPITSTFDVTAAPYEPRAPPNNMAFNDGTHLAASMSSSTIMPGSPLYAKPLDEQIPEQLNYETRKSLVERIAKLEEMLEENMNKHKKEVEHLKNQLFDQMEQCTKQKMKAKQYKFEAKSAQESLSSYSNLEKDYEKLHKTIEEERRNLLSERSGKSLESKKIISKLKIEIEEANKKNDELKKYNDLLQRENEKMTQSLESLQLDLHSRDKSVLMLKDEVKELTKLYKSTQQLHMQERFDTAQLRLRIAYANCEGQIRERSSKPNPEQYRYTEWQEVQQDIKCRIDSNNFKHNNYLRSMLDSEPLSEITFEEEPLCPIVETDIPILPLQRYDDILQGRPPPPLPLPVNPPGPFQASASDLELTVLADLMQEVSTFNPSGDTNMFSSSPNFNHALSDSHPPPNNIGLGNMMNQHYDILDSPAGVSETRQPGAKLPTSSSPSLGFNSRSKGFLPGATESSAVTDTRQMRGRGRARNGRSTVGGPVGVTSERSSPLERSADDRGIAPPVSQVTTKPSSKSTLPNGAPTKGTALKNKIKEKFNFLSDKEIMSYLKRVREDTQGMSVTSAIALERVSSLVALDYPVTTSPTTSSSTEPPRPSNTCVICHEALNLQVVSTLGCGHEFHKDCVDQWFNTQNHTCPTCRSHQPPVEMFPPLTG